MEGRPPEATKRIQIKTHTYDQKKCNSSNGSRAGTEGMLQGLRKLQKGLPGSGLALPQPEDEGAPYPCCPAKNRYAFQDSPRTI